MARTVIVGDIHGCAAELENLLERLAFTSDDRLVSVGDLVGRGPNTLGVLRLFREHRGRAVLGNHEARLLEVHREIVQGKRPSRLGLGHQRVLRELRDEDWSWIESLPLHLELPEHGVRVVHAGLDPARTMAEQDPWIVTHVRTIDPQGKPSHRLGAEPWATHYRGPPHIAFGHSAQLSLQLHRDATGLDTGCVYGGQLTAMVLAEGQLPPPPFLRPAVLVGVPARQRYYEAGS